MKDGDTFWLHICPHKPEFRQYIPVGKTCRFCDWEELSDKQKAIVRQREHIERMEQNYDT